MTKLTERFCACPTEVLELLANIVARDYQDDPDMLELVDEARDWMRVEVTLTDHGVSLLRREGRGAPSPR